MYVTICVYQDGSLTVLSPYTVNGPAPSKHFMNVITGLPMQNRMQELTSDDVRRWKMPVGWPYLPIVLTEFEKNGFKLVNGGGCGPLDKGDLVYMYLMQRS